MKKLVSCLCILSLCLSLCACGKAKEPETGGDSVDGWIPAEFAAPEELRMDHSVTYSDGVFYQTAKRDGKPLICVYDTLSGAWSELPVDLDELPEDCYLGALSAADGALWGLLRVYLPARDDLFYLLYYDLAAGTCSRHELRFEGGHNTESSGLSFAGVYALSRARAIVYDWERGYEIDETGALLRTVPGLTPFGSSRNAERTYLYCDQGEDASALPFDPASLVCGAPLPVSVRGQFVSDAGRLLCNLDGWSALGVFDPETGETRKLFDWIDVALDYESMGGLLAFENRQGEIWYPGGKGYIRLTEGQIPYRKPLILATPGRAGLYLDSILYFNHTDPEYRIELRQMEAAEGADYDRQLIELATGSGVDLIDTSLLPESSLDGSLLADLLPFLDADPELGREDFIQPLLRSMLRKGGLYELQPCFTLLSMATHGDLYPGRDAWTLDYVNRLAASYPEMTLFYPGRDRDVLLDSVSKMATAEFVDYENAVCHFDDPRFREWLQFCRDASYTRENEDRAALLLAQGDVAGDIGYFCRLILHDADYVYSGFPSTSGNGSYFIRLGSDGSVYDESTGVFIRLGIPASSQHQDGAWRFLKVLLTRTEWDVSYGIPVLRSSFEQALSLAVEHGAALHTDAAIPWFTEGDAQRLRDLVYATEKMVHDDPALLDIIRAEAGLYFDGYRTLDEAAAAVQSRASLYVSEQYG
ncbi:MAG: hypothetical protein IJ594_09870 [Oscillospiraceae bacterium]|nr:hypothetical protein [Oscillospiraceae bacterium]